jgi:transcriptional regulator with XRE-family HTH domain
MIRPREGTMSAEVKRVRDALNITQRDLAALLGVDPITVSKWERGGLKPGGYQCALLATFWNATENQPGVGIEAVNEFQKRGLGRALLILLTAAYVR